MMSDVRDNNHGLWLAPLSRKGSTIQAVGLTYLIQIYFNLQVLLYFCIVVYMMCNFYAEAFKICDDFRYTII